MIKDRKVKIKGIRLKKSLRSEGIGHFRKNNKDHESTRSRRKKVRRNSEGKGKKKIRQVRKVEGMRVSTRLVNKTWKREVRRKVIKSKLIFKRERKESIQCLKTKNRKNKVSEEGRTINEIINICHQLCKTKRPTRRRNEEGPWEIG